jgi:hypothetical protein
MKLQFLITGILFAVSLGFIQTRANAQNDASLSKKSYFKIAADYLSNAVYSGRKDSEVVSYFSPSIGYFNKSGFSLNATMSFLTNSDNAGRIDEALVEAAYDFSIKDHIDGGFYADKYFYSDNSYAVTSELQGDVGGYLSYNNDILTIGGGADALISTPGTDLTINGNLSHPFTFGGDNNSWTISPTAEVNAGTQSFYRAYYKNRKFNFSSGSKRKGHGSGGGNSGNSKVISFPKQDQFSVLDYELSIPITYDAKKWGLFATPVIAIPVNPATFAIDGVTQKEVLTTSFFAKAGAYYKF